MIKIPGQYLNHIFMANPKARNSNSFPPSKFLCLQEGLSFKDDKDLNTIRERMLRFQQYPCLVDSFAEGERFLEEIRKVNIFRPEPWIKMLIQVYQNDYCSRELPKFNLGDKLLVTERMNLFRLHNSKMEKIILCPNIHIRPYSLVEIINIRAQEVLNLRQLRKYQLASIDVQEVKTYDYHRE